eukprot:5268082-Pleurochrysis_carterae.AAC.1
MLDEYMALHYATHDDSIPPSLPTSLNNAVSSSTSKGVELAGALHFPQRCAGLVGTWAEKLGVTQERALDIGCAVGGSTFELARGFNQVVGVDLSASFIQAAQVHATPEAELKMAVLTRVLAASFVRALLFC